MSKREPQDFPPGVILRNARGETLHVPMQNEGNEPLGVVWIDDVPYHVFFARPAEIGSGGENFILDRDPSYRPRLGPSGKSVLIAPYAE
jgi:hypothetical protein